MDPNITTPPIPMAKSKGPLQKLASSKVALLLTILAILVAGSFVISKYYPNLIKKTPTAYVPPNEKLIAKVGEENIYESDLLIEQAYLGPIPGLDTRKYLLAKIATDSAILQSANAMGIATLSATVYNSQFKDYMKRVDLVKKIKQQIDKKSDHTIGAVVSLFFINNLDNRPGPLGYDKSKQLAYQIMTDLQQKVKNKQMTIEEAGEAIRKNPQAKDLDYSYIINSYFSFDKHKGEHITLDEKIDQVLWGLKPGEVSPVVVGRVIDDQQRTVEGVYMFGQISSNSPSDIYSLDQWIQDQVKKYEIKYY